MMDLLPQELYDIEIEGFALAGLLSGDKPFYEGTSILTTNHFFDKDYQQIYECISGFAKTGRPVYQAIYKSMRDKVDSHKLIALNKVVTEDSYDYWLDQIQSIYIRRTYWLAAREIQSLAIMDKPIKEISEIVEQKIMKVHTQEGTDRIITPEEAGKSALEEFEKRQDSLERVHGIKLSREVPTGGMPGIDGFPGLDQLFRGVRGGDLILIAARTGDGKTALAQNIVRHASFHQQYRTFYQNTEMKPDEIVFRFVAAMSGVSFEGIDGGGLDSWQRSMARRYFELYSESHIYISELPMLTPQRSRGLARQFKMKYGKLDLLVIDYIGRMELDNNKGKQEWQILRDVAKECKRLAQELDTGVLLISQLTEEGKLQGAKAIANECDGVLYLEALNSEEWADAPKGATHKLKTEKARRGKKGTKMWISFNKDKMHMTEVVNREGDPR